MAEIQELTNLKAWWYVDSTRNTADDLTQAKTLKDLLGASHWTQGPHFLVQHEWSSSPSEPVCNYEVELKKSTFCGRITSLAPGTNGSKYNSWQELEEAIAKELHEAEGLTGQPRGSTYKEADFEAMRRVQMDSFQEDYWHFKHLKTGQPVQCASQLLCLSLTTPVCLSML